MKNKSLIISILFVFIGIVAVAQQHNEQVTVEGSYRPQIKRSERLTKTPEAPVNEFNIPNYKAEAKDFNYSYNMDVEPMSAVPYKADYGVEGKNNFLKAGIGTRLSPVFLFRHYSDLSNNMSIGVGVKHYSSWLNLKDYKKSSFMNNAFNVMTINKFRSGQLRSFADYKYDMYHLRAYNDIKNPNGRNINSLNFGAKWLASGSSYRNLYSEIGGDYRATWIVGGTQEHQLNANAHLAYSDNWINHEKVDDLQTFAADVELNYNDVYQSQLLLAINPYFTMNGEFYHVHVGARLDLKTGDNVGLYPDVRGSVFILDNMLEFYAKFGGRSKINTFADIVAKNPFVTTNFSSFGEFGYEKTKFSFQGGVKAKITNNIDAHLGVHYRTVKNSVYFVPDRDFYVAYEGDETIYHLNAFNIIFQDCDLTTILADVRLKTLNKLNLAAEFAFNISNFHNPDLTQNPELAVMYGKPWYRPRYTFTLRGDYQLDETWKFNAALKYLGNRWMLTPDYEVIDVKRAIDVQCGVDYQVMEDFAAFAEIHNLYHQKYQLYYNYPSLGFEIYAGIKYRF